MDTYIEVQRALYDDTERTAHNVGESESARVGRYSYGGRMAVVWYSYGGRVAFVWYSFCSRWHLVWRPFVIFAAVVHIVPMPGGTVFLGWEQAR